MRTRRLAAHGGDVTADPPTVPFVSLLLAVRNEAAVVEQALGALARQDYPPSRMELIVADGGSSDGTPDRIRAFYRDTPYDVRVLENPLRSAAAGFNRALRSARGSIIVVLGARALPARDFLSKSVEALRESGADGVGGVVTAVGEGAEAEALALALGWPFGVGARYRYASAPGDVDTVNYGAYRREVFEQLGGFDQTMENVEDDEFNYRLRAAGKRLYLSPLIRCRYLIRPNLGALLRQYARYGFSKPRVLRRHPRQMQPRQFAPAALLATLLVGLAAYRCSSLMRWLFWLAVGSYAAANGIASLSIVRSRGRRTLPYVPAAFLAMHVGYGGASLAGTLRFLIWPLLRRRPDAGEIPMMEWSRGE